MRATHSTMALAVALGACGLLGSLACDCGDTTPGPCMCPDELKCETDADCEEGVSCLDDCCGGCWECLEDADCEGEDMECVDGVCRQKAVCEHPCVVTADCGDCERCVDECCVSSECSSDADCPPVNDKPRYCPPDPDPQTGCRECLYVRCVTDEDCEDPDFPLYQECPENQFPRCALGLCECAQPCGGDCPAGQYCCYATNHCDPIPDPCAGEPPCGDCMMRNPEPGGELDPEQCAWVGVDCSCVPLPDLPDAFAGQHSAVALDADGIPVLSGYFGQPYGDLIFGVASAFETGAAVDWVFVDGVPADAPCEGNAAGPRNGIAEPGDDVGWDTDIVFDGLFRISYFDRTHGALKYAVSADGLTWDVHMIDDQGLTGRYTSMAVGPDGRPMIAYMCINDAGSSALKLAWANAGVTDPRQAGDWTIHVLDDVEIGCLPGTCAAGEVCLESGACAAADDPLNCNAGAGCGDGEACVAGACQVLMPEPGLDDLPVGVGVFASLALFSDGSPLVVYYDNSLVPALKSVAWNGSGFDAPQVLGGLLFGMNGDCSLFIDGSDAVHVAYQDLELGELYYIHAGAGGPELVDQGARDADGNPTDPAGAVGDLHWVGNFSSLVVDSAGNARIAYQDGTSLDMLHATRGGAGTWQLEIIARKLAEDAFDGAYGFFIDQALDGADTAIITSFKHNLRTEPYSSAIDLRTYTVP
ncbi:MAG: hypothetical protein JXR96_25260 [Deltaproteobacteria bacterium]|nr:hypothetical protein [Deltaproteobacteria bacterium]